VARTLPACGSSVIRHPPSEFRCSWSHAWGRPWGGLLAARWPRPRVVPDCAFRKVGVHDDQHDRPPSEQAPPRIWPEQGSLAGATPSTSRATWNKAGNQGRGFPPLMPQARARASLPTPPSPFEGGGQISPGRVRRSVFASRQARSTGTPLAGPGAGGQAMGRALWRGAPSGMGHGGGPSGLT